MDKLKALFGIVMLCSALNLFAQQSINASGGEATGTGYASYSVGQITYTVIESTNDDASILQGVQIPFEAIVTSCPTDFNFDGRTDGDDFVIFLGNFGIGCTSPPCPTDINSDGETDGDDFVIFLGNFGLICN